SPSKFVTLASTSGGAQPTMPLSPGDQLDRYTIEDALGHGGMGDVYVAFDARLQRRVALKILRARDAVADPSSDPSSRMLREARAAAALQHPNVAAVFDVVEGSGGIYIAMELVRGRSLRGWIADGTSSLEQRIRWLADVARALGAAHRAGVVHRDVKP